MDLELSSIYLVLQLKVKGVRTLGELPYYSIMIQTL